MYKSRKNFETCKHLTMIRVTILLAVVALFAHKSESAKTGLTLTKLGAGFYYFRKGQGTATTWYEADNFCRSYGLTLLSIESQAEQDLLQAELLRLGSGNGHWYWTSGSDNAKEGDFYWTANGNALNFTSWNTGEPNNAGVENCLTLNNVQGVLKWNDASCAGLGEFVCELPTLCWGF